VDGGKNKNNEISKLNDQLAQLKSEKNKQGDGSVSKDN